MTSISALIPQDVFQTERLNLNLLSKRDAAFVQELTNTKGWLKFIGDRGTTTIEGTEKYIQKIEENPNCKFWKVSLNEKDTPIGFVTLIQRDYLDIPDIGFAFLPKFGNKGYAYEATKVVLDETIKQSAKGVCGITNKENIRSIHLLKKLGLISHSIITEDGETLEVYSLPLD